VKILALSYFYPPNGESGTHRSLYLLNELAAGGDEVTVVTAKQEDFSLGTPLDSELLYCVHPSIRILRAAVHRPLYRLLELREWLRGRAPTVPGASFPSGATESHTNGRTVFQACKDAVSDLLTFPDEHVGWIPDALKKSSRAIRNREAECIYSSGGPWSSHFAAVLLKKRYGLPLVLDFRDPWASNPYRVVGRGRLMYALERRLESFCVRSADHVVVNTQPLQEDFTRRFPQERAAKFTTITNGFENLLNEDAGERDPCFTVLHAGCIYPPRDPTAFFVAVRQLVRAGLIEAGELKVRLLGGCPSSPALAQLLATPELTRVIEILPRVSHSLALRYQRDAQVLLLFQNGFPLQVPRKLFEYMSVLRPVLAITERDSATAAIVLECGIGLIAEADVGSISRALLELYTEWKEGKAHRIELNRILRFRNDALGRELRGVLRRVSEPRAAAPLGV
jgi:hypothetical protein